MGVKGGITIKKLRYLFADLLFLIGHYIVTMSARTMRDKETVQQLKEQRAKWLKEEAFKEE